MKNLMCLTCEVLRFRLMEAHLVTTGNKAALVERLLQHEASYVQGSSGFYTAPRRHGHDLAPWTQQTIRKMEQKFRIPNLHSFHATCSANASKVSSGKFGERYAQGDTHSSGKKRLQTAEIRTGSPSPNPPPCPCGHGTARQETRASQGDTHPCNRFESDTICHLETIIPRADPPRRGIILHDPRHPKAAQAELQ